MQYRKTPYVMVAPALIFLLLIMGYPLVTSISMSFTNKLVGAGGHFVGLSNFLRLLGDEIFLRTLWNTLLYTGVTVSLKVVLGFFLASTLIKIVRGRRILLSVLLLPWAMPTSLSALAWWWMYNSRFGVLNAMFTRMGLFAIPWLSSPFWARIAVITANVWRGIPFFGICFLAGLVSISKEFYEVAALNGAGVKEKFWYVTLPFLRPILGIITLYSLVTTFADFELVWIITKGGPRQSTHLFGTLAFQVGLVGTRIGEGAAISLFIFPVLAISAFLLLRVVLRKGVEIEG